MKKFAAFFLCSFAFALSNNSEGQGSIKIKKNVLVSPNSTSHIFKLPYNSLKDTLIPLFKFHSQFNNTFLNRIFHHPAPLTATDWRNTYFEAETAKGSRSYYSDIYFTKPDRDNDILIWNSNAWESPVYYARGNALPFNTAFVLKLKVIDSNQTMLTVEAQSPEVNYNYTTWSECECGIFPQRFKKVKPTTIEEHAILEYIGDKLGDVTVEPLKLPAPLSTQTY
jgi:hypothetical protein